MGINTYTDLYNEDIRKAKEKNQKAKENLYIVLKKLEMDFLMTPLNDVGTNGLAHISVAVKNELKRLVELWFEKYEGLRLGDYTILPKDKYDKYKDKELYGKILKQTVVEGKMVYLVELHR